MNKTCSIWWCNRPHYAKGFCHTHWIAKRRFGSPYGKFPKHDLQAEIMLRKAERLSEFILEGYIKMDTSDGCPLCHSTDRDTHNKDCLVLDAYLIVNFRDKKENAPR